MKKILFLAGIIIGGLLSADGQTPGGTPTPAQATVTVISTSRVDDEIYDTQRRTNPRDRVPGTTATVRNPAFRKPSKEDLRLVAPDAGLREKYADFLREPHTGLIRLLSDAGCQENAATIVATDFCIKYKNIFGGSAYSFRTENYTLGRFSDVVYKNGALYSVGRMTLGFLVDLGADVLLKDVSTQSSGARYVFNFLPPDDLAQIEALLANFQKGVAADGFNYRKFYALQENHTYLLRSVAYRKREQRERNGPIYDELADDERKDVVIAFQVVKFADAEKSGVTLLWKELQRKNTSKIALGKN